MGWSGTITASSAVGTSITFTPSTTTEGAYTVSSFTAPKNGVYHFVLYGSGGTGVEDGGGEGGKAGGVGGQTKGYLLLEKNQTVYIGAGGTCSAAFVSSATGSSLASIDKSKLYLVAGAGGGGAKYADNENGTGWNCKVYVGGTGGGVRGGDGGYSVWAVATSGGTQSAGGSSTDDGGAGSYGKGGTPSSQTDGSYWCSGGRGGDGYYGGAGGFGDAHYNGVDADGGAGGSGYIGGCPSFSYAGVVYSSSTEVGKGSAANTVGKVTVTIVAQYEPSTFTISENGVETSSIYAGVSITFNVTNPDTTAYPELYHTFDIRFGSLSQSHTLPVNTLTLEYDIPLDWIIQIPSATSGTCYITMTTLKDGAVIGTKSKSLRINVPSSIIPTPGTMSIERINNAVPESWNIYIQTKSGVKISVSGAAGVYGSQISSYKYVVGTENVSSSSATRSHSSIANSGTVTIYVVVTDTRGRTSTTNSTSIVVYPYQNPYVSSTEVMRCLEDGTLEDQAAYAKAKWSNTYSSCNGNNSYTTNLAYRLYGDLTWTYVGAYTTSPVEVVFGDGKIDTDFTYEVLFRIEDAFGSTEKICVINSSFFTMHFKQGGKGVSFGCPSKIDNAVVIDKSWTLYHGDQDVFNNITNLGTEIQNTKKLIPGEWAIVKVFTFTLPTSGWVQNSSGAYTQTVSVSGILSTDSPIADIDVSSMNTSNASDYEQSWGYIQSIVTSNGSITASCYEKKPTVNMPVKLLVVRTQTN